MRTKDAGLTHLELLVSLAVMSILAIALANALQFMGRAQDRSLLISDQTERYLTIEALRDAVAEIPLNYAGQSAEEFFEGDDTTLRFRTLVKDGSFAAGTPVELVVRMEAGALVLMATGQHPTTNRNHSLTRDLALAPRDVTLTYYGRKSTDRIRAWHDDWHDPVLLPDLVKLEWARQTGQPAPPITLRPALIERQRDKSRSSPEPPG